MPNGPWLTPPLPLLAARADCLSAFAVTLSYRCLRRLTRKMNDKPKSDCPAVDIEAILASTADVAATRSWGVVTGTGATPEDALTDLCQQAQQRGEKLFRALWDQGAGATPPPQWWKNIEQTRSNGAKLKATFSIGTVRFAHGQIEKEPRWLAYGTLLTDNTGDGTNWVQVAT
jgi:hypothetical protein